MNARAKQDVAVPSPGSGRSARGVSFLVLAGLLISLNVSPGAVRFDVFLGHDQIVPEASWFPITFEVFNDGAPFMGMVEVSPGSYDSSHTRIMAVELPTGTLKRFTIPAFSSGRYVGGWNARLLDEKGKVRAEQQNLRVRQTTPWQTPTFAGVSRTLPSVPKIKSNQPEMQPVVARFQPAVFPDNPITLEGLDTIYVQAERALDLKVNQVNALLSWLNAGGHLVIGVEQILHVNGNEWLKNVLPCEFTGMKMEPNHRELHEFVISDRRRDGGIYKFRGSRAVPVSSKRRALETADVSSPYAKLPEDTKFESTPVQVATGIMRDGEILVGSASAPLVITAPRGRGQLTVLTFSPELEPFLSWTNRPHFWAKMMDLPPYLLVDEANQHYTGMGQSLDGVFGAMIDSKQVRKLPVGWLLVLLVGYLVVIGPLDRYWLNRINRQMLTWITFPIYVALFSVLIYFIGYKLRAGESEWNELHVVDVMPAAGEQAGLRGRTYGSIYSPVNARYRLAGEQTFSALRGEFMSYGGQEASRATIEQRGNNFQAEISVPVWTSQLYVSDWWRQAAAPVKIAVAQKGATYEVEVENLLERKLTPCKLVVDGQVLDLGEIPAKETRKLTLNKGGENLNAFVQRHGASFATAVNQRQQAFGDNAERIFDIPQSTMAASFITQLRREDNYPYNQFVSPAGMDMSALVERGNAVLLAWVEDFSATKPINKFDARRSHKDTLLRVATVIRN